MDYVEAFRNLKTNAKYGRKSPQKAVLLLAVIELYEKNVLSDNSIFYDSHLKSEYKFICDRIKLSKVEKGDSYVPFWELQSDSFWHIVPKRGKEDILQLMLDSDIKPSEKKLVESVQYAELDEDLFFLMTISSGRSSLKRALLESFTDLPTSSIDKLSESTNNTINSYEVALSEYDKIVNSNKSIEEEKQLIISGKDEESFLQLDEDLQITINYEYYSFLKSHLGERHQFRQLFPSVNVLYGHICNNSLKKEDISPAFLYTYEDFLSGLRFALMSDNNSTDLVEKISLAIESLHPKESSKYFDNDIENNESSVGGTIIEESAKVNQKIIDNQVKAALSIDNDAYLSQEEKPWSEYEDELITLFFKQGKKSKDIASIVGRTELSIKMRFAKLGLIESNNTLDNAIQLGVKIKNAYTRCYILNNDDEIIFTDSGSLKFLSGNLYRFKVKPECFTVKDMQKIGERWLKGSKKIVAYSNTDLYSIVNTSADFLNDIEEIFDVQNFNDCRIKVNGVWYDFEGNRSNFESTSINGILKKHNDNSYTPKGQLKAIDSIACNSFDFLWVMALIEFMQLKPQPSFISYDKMACMMIAIAWEIFANHKEALNKKDELNECIEFLIKESNNGMKEKLSWESNKKDIYNSIKDFPMYGVFEDMVDLLISSAPYNVLKAWFKDESKSNVLKLSRKFEKACLYAIHDDNNDPFIEVNKVWQRSLFFEHDNLIDFFTKQYLDFLDDC